MARWIESWLPGAAASPDAGVPGSYPGQQLGMPRSGTGSAAGFGRRLAAELARWFPEHTLAMDAGVAKWAVTRRAGGAPITIRRRAAG